MLQEVKFCRNVPHASLSNKPGKILFIHAHDICEATKK